VIEPRALTDLMAGIACRGGQTQIGRVLRHVRNEAASAPVRALVYVGDAMEEPVDALCAVAGELGLLGIKAFHVPGRPRRGGGRCLCRDRRLSGGAYARFRRERPALARRPAPRGRRLRQRRGRTPCAASLPASRKRGGSSPR
jgi:hypothetical protein